jgi:hypothetical protein
MFLLRQPSPETIRRFISSQCELPFYPEVGATAGQLPPGYNVDRNLIMLGTGKGTYERAFAALLSKDNGVVIGSGIVLIIFLPFSMDSSDLGTIRVNEALGGAWFCGEPQVEATRFSATESSE